MAEPTFSSRSSSAIEADDDLPRTLRRERDAQERRARESAYSASQDVLHGDKAVPDERAPPYEGGSFDRDTYGIGDYEPVPAAVTRFDVPFLHLMLFFLKAVVAGLPALVLLMAILWGIGELLTATFPDLVKMQILIRMPN